MKKNCWTIVKTLKIRCKNFSISSSFCTILQEIQSTMRRVKWRLKIVYTNNVSPLQQFKKVFIERNYTRAIGQRRHCTNQLVKIVLALIIFYIMNTDINKYKNLMKKHLPNHICEKWKSYLDFRTCSICSCIHIKLFHFP